jgi:hypothetical protein
VEIEETSMVDLCLCFLSLRRVESGEGEARGGEYSGTEATLSEKERGQDGRWL